MTFRTKASCADTSSVRATPMTDTCAHSRVTSRDDQDVLREILHRPVHITCDAQLAAGIDAHTRGCAVCGEQLQPDWRGPRRKFCSKRCQKRSWRSRTRPPKPSRNPVPPKIKTFICRHCANEITYQKNARGGRDRIFCSPDCRSTFWQSGGRQRKRAPKMRLLTLDKGDPVTFSCAHCKMISTYLWTSGPLRIHCSKLCGSAAYKARKRAERGG